MSQPSPTKKLNSCTLLTPRAPWELSSPKLTSKKFWHSATSTSCRSLPMKHTPSRPSQMYNFGLLGKSQKMFLWSYCAGSIFIKHRMEKLYSVPGWCTSWSVLFDKHHYLKEIWFNMTNECTIFLHSNVFTMLALPDIFQKVGIFIGEGFSQLKASHDQLYHQISVFFF